MEATPVTPQQPAAAIVQQPVVNVPVKINWRGLLNTWQQKNGQRCQGPPLFEAATEEGPPHARLFKFTCKLTLDGVAQVVEGQGQSKKIAKAQAAKRMYGLVLGIDEATLDAQGPPAIVPSVANPSNTAAGKPHVPDQSKNFVGKLHQFVQTHKHLSPSSPVFELVNQTTSSGQARPGVPNQIIHQFTMEVKIVVNGEEKKAQGTGRKKKEAKQNAAEALIAILPVDPTRVAGKKRKGKFGNQRNKKSNRGPPTGGLANIGIHQDLAQKAEEAYKNYTTAVSKGEDADELYKVYRDLYQNYANHYAQSYNAQLNQNKNGEAAGQADASAPPAASTGGTGAPASRQNGGSVFLPNKGPGATPGAAPTTAS